MADLPTYIESTPPPLVDDLSRFRGSAAAKVPVDRTVVTDLGGGLIQTTYVDAPAAPVISNDSVTR